MTFYEIIIRRNEENAVVISARTELIKAIEFLDASARNGDIAGTAAVRLYDDVQVAGRLLIQLLGQLNQDTSWILANETYSVYLSEV